MWSLRLFPTLMSCQHCVLMEWWTWDMSRYLNGRYLSWYLVSSWLPFLFWCMMNLYNKSYMLYYMPHVSINCEWWNKTQKTGVSSRELLLRLGTNHFLAAEEPHFIRWPTYELRFDSDSVLPAALCPFIWPPLFQPVFPTCFHPGRGPCTCAYAGRGLVLGVRW